MKNANWQPYQEGRRNVLIVVILDSRQMQKHEVKTWLSICGISLCVRGYADGKAVKAASEE